MIREILDVLAGATILGIMIAAFVLAVAVSP